MLVASNHEPYLRHKQVVQEDAAKAYIASCDKTTINNQLDFTSDPFSAADEYVSSEWLVHSYGLEDIYEMADKMTPL